MATGKSDEKQLEKSELLFYSNLKVRTKIKELIFKYLSNLVVYEESLRELESAIQRSSSHFRGFSKSSGGFYSQSCYDKTCIKEAIEIFDLAVHDKMDYKKLEDFVSYAC